jgi:hypothetical protein
MGWEHSGGNPDAHEAACDALGVELVAGMVFLVPDPAKGSLMRDGCV